MTSKGLMPSEGVFGPKNLSRVGKQQTPLKAAFIDKCMVHLLPGGVSEETREKIAFAMMMTGGSKDDMLGPWKQYIATYTFLMFPGLRKKADVSGFVFREVPMNEVNGIIQKIDSLIEALNSEDQTRISTAAAMLEGKAIYPGLPTIPSELDWMAGHGEWVTKVIACHYSLVLFLCGKRLEGDDHSAITKRRPDALRKKAHLGDTIAFLDGPLRLSDVSHLQINNAWAEVSSLRSVCIQEFALFSGMNTDFVQDIIHTSMHLLRYSGMQHAKITHDFLRANEWAVDLPSLRTPIGVYVDSVKAASRYPREIQPYIKLIYGDKADVFPRKELEPLIACALSVGRELNESLNDFYASGEFGPVVEAFLNERERRERIRQGEIVKREGELNLMEEDGEETDTDTPASGTE